MSRTRAITNQYSVDGRSIEALKIDSRRSILPTIVMVHEGLGSFSHWKDSPS